MNIKGKKDLEQLVIEGIREITGTLVSDNDQLLVSRSIRMNAYDLTYLVEYLESKLGRTIAQIFVDKNYRFLTVNNIVDELYNLV